MKEPMMNEMQRTQKDQKEKDNHVKGRIGGVHSNHIWSYSSTTTGDVCAETEHEREASPEAGSRQQIYNKLSKTSSSTWSQRTRRSQISLYERSSQQWKT